MDLPVGRQVRTEDMPAGISSGNWLEYSEIKKSPLFLVKIVIVSYGGPEWIRTTEAEAKDLQSSPFDRSGTDPYSLCLSPLSL